MFTSFPIHTVSLFRKVGVIALLLIAVLLLAGASNAAASPTTIVLDWETDANGVPLLRGQIVSNTTLFHNMGGVVDVDLSVSSVLNKGIIFDSAIPGPSGIGDPDLGTPNNTCNPPGPGVGTGGQLGQPGENCTAQGNLLVIPQNQRDSDGDGLIDIPSDDYRGGIIWLAFSQPVLIEYVDIMDQETSESVTITAFADLAGTVPVATANPTGLGDNSFEVITLNAPGTRLLQFDFQGSGAIAAVAFDPQGTLAVTMNGMDSNDVGVSPLVWPGVLVLALATLAVWQLRRRSPVTL